MSLFASRSSHWSSRTSTQRARVKSEGMSTRSRRLRWWEGGSQWEASQGSHARCAGSVRAVVGSGQGGQAHPSCPASARVPAQHFDPEESRTCGIHCTCTLGIQDPVNPALLPKKVGANGEPFAHRTDIFFTRTHNRGISLRRRYLLPPEADNQWAGRGRTSSPPHPCDGCHRVPSQVVQGKYLDIPGGDISPTSWTSNTSG